MTDMKLKPGYDDDRVAPRPAVKRKAKPMTVDTSCNAVLEPDDTALVERDQRGAEPDIRTPRGLNPSQQLED